MSFWDLALARYVFVLSRETVCAEEKKRGKKGGIGNGDESRKALPSQFKQNLAVLVAFERWELIPVSVATGMENPDIRGGGEYPQGGRAILCVGEDGPLVRRVGCAVEGARERGGIQSRGVGRGLGVAGKS